MKTTLFILVVAVSLVACSSKVNYNDTVVGLYGRYNTEMKKIFTETNPEAAIDVKKAAIQRLETLTDSCTKVMEGLKPGADAKEFHQVLSDLYSTVKRDFLPPYKKLLAIANPDKNTDEYNKLIEEVNVASEKIGELEDKAITAQAEFARKANMKLR